MSEVSIQMAKTGSGRFGVPGMCGIKRLKQSCLTERLEKAVYGTLWEHVSPDVFICASSDEDNRDLLLPTGQLPRSR
jgi:hypothetical protein